MVFWLAAFAVVCAAIPAFNFLINLSLFKPPNCRDDGKRDITQAVSILIPARNEAQGIEAAIRCCLRSSDLDIEVIVLDDHSDDETAAIVNAIANQDPRVRLIVGAPLEEAWNGKQFACYQLAQAARHSRLLFIDADVRLKPGAIACLLECQDQSQVALLSAFPRQITGTWLEKLLIPLMHFVLLGFLPFARMRRSNNPAYAAGCGQLFLTSREHYELAGTHAAIKSSRHDGVKLPRAYRKAGLSTDVIDGTPLAECRMYTNSAEVHRGLLKNAVEGIANPKLIVPFSIVLLGGSLIPWIAGAVAIIQSNVQATGISALAIVLNHLPRAIAAHRFRQPWQGVVFHSIAIAIFVAIQWQALINHIAGRKVQWRGRA